MWPKDGGRYRSVRHVSARIVILTKAPVPGRVKTRLARDIGAEAAATVHELMVFETIRLAKQTDLPIILSLALDDDGRFAERIETLHVRVEDQASGDLGHRLTHAMRRPGPSIALGTDCVVFDPRCLVDLDLAPNGACIGPSDDGGYWTIALDGSKSEICEAVFAEMPWSTPMLFSATEARLASIGCPVSTLPGAYDVDCLADLRRLARDPRCAEPLRAAIRPLL